MFVQIFAQFQILSHFVPLGILYNYIIFLFQELGDVDRQHLVENIASSLGQALKEVQNRMIPIFTKVDPAFGSMVKQALAKKSGK